MHYHGGGGGLAMTAANHYPYFVTGLFIDVLREGYHIQPHLLCSKQFRVICTGMHPEDDSVNITRQSFGVPTVFFRKYTCSSKPRTRGLEDLVIRAGDIITFHFKSKGQVMHNSSADSYEVYFHGHGFLQAKIPKLAILHLLKDA